jgi:hypothetical protein
VQQLKSSRVTQPRLTFTRTPLLGLVRAGAHTLVALDSLLDIEWRTIEHVRADA